MKFIASIFIILAFTPQSEAGEFWDFARATLCPNYTDHILCAKANKEDYYSGKCEGTLTLSPAETEKLALLVEDENNKEDIAKLTYLNAYGRNVCFVPSFLKRDYNRQLKRDYDRRQLDCLVEDFLSYVFRKTSMQRAVKFLLI